MARTLTPERQQLALEARNLREFGYTQQEIADTTKEVTTLNDYNKRRCQTGPSNQRYPY